MRLGGSAGAISQEVVQRLASIMGSNVRVTLEIGADVPDGIPEKAERDVSENCNTLRFREYVCVSKLQRFPGVVNDTAGPNPSKTYMHIPPLFMCEISVVNCNLPSSAQVKRK